MYIIHVYTCIVYMYMYVSILHTSCEFSSIRGESLTLQKGRVTASAWRDNKVFIVMSTCCQPNESGSVQRRQRDGTRLNLPCPSSIISYNAYMGGVDHGDQLRGYYSCRSKSRKFYKYIFYFLLDTAVTNAYILHTRYSDTPTFQLMKDFRVALAKSLIADYCSRRRPGRGGHSLHALPLRHFPIKVDGSTRSKRGRCSVCTGKGRRNDSSWWCQECGIWLCHNGDKSTDCFLQWHKNMHEE